VDRIETLRALIAVVDTGSFSAAATRLGTSPQVVSKYVKALEVELDQQLLYRTTRKLALTEAGRAHLPRCRQLVDDYDELRRTARAEDREPRGHLVITAPVTFGERVLADVVLRFMAAHPQISIELKLTDQHLALVDEGVDLAIRIGQLEDANLIIRRLGNVPIVCCASPGYLARSGMPKHPSDLAEHACILDSNFRDPGLWRFRQAEGSVAVKVSGRLKVNSAEAAAHAALAGGGIALIPSYIIDAPLRDQRLLPVLTDSPDYDFGLFAAYLPSRHLAAKVRSFIDFLVAEWKGGRTVSR
jgi:DNA-binding transcriptional LysR family regulator